MKHRYFMVFYFTYKTPLGGYGSGYRNCEFTLSTKFGMEHLEELAKNVRTSL